MERNLSLRLKDTEYVANVMDWEAQILQLCKLARVVKVEEWELWWCNWDLECIHKEQDLVMIVVVRENLLMIRRSARHAKGKKSRRKRRSLRLKLIRGLLMEKNILFMEKLMKSLIVNLEMFLFKSLRRSISSLQGKELIWQWIKK